jgi:PAS domain S-box-containing protein
MKTKKPEALEKINDRQKWEIFDYLADAIYVTSYDGHFLYVNAEASKLWGKSREEIEGQPLYIVFPQAKGSVLEEKRRECIASGKPLVAEFYFPSPPFEGWYEMVQSPCPEGIITRFKLIPEKKKASYSIDFLYELISMVLNQLEEPVVITDLRYKIKECNSTLAKFANVQTKSAIIGKDFFEQFCPGKEKDIKPAFHDVFNKHKSKTIHMNQCQMTISTIFDYFDLPLYYIIFIRKMERKDSIKLSNTASSADQQESQLTIQNSITNKEPFYQSLWDQSGIPTAIFNPKGDLINVNEAMNTLFSEQIKLDYNLLNDSCITKETRKKIRDNQTIHLEKYFGPEETKVFFSNKTTATRKEYYLDVLIKPFFTNKLILEGYILKLVDRLEIKKKEELRDQLFDRILSSAKKSTEHVKESINTLLMFVKETEDKKFLTKNLKLQKQILSSLVREIGNFKKAESE